MLYEWRREGDSRVPVWIHLKKKEPFAFAGLWDLWRDLEARRSIHSRLSRHSRIFASAIYNRMPVIFDRLSAKQWLDPFVRWEKRYRSFVGETGGNEYYDSEEAVTNADGRFVIGARQTYGLIL